MTDEKVNVRKERIEQLLRQLQYEVVRGMMEREIDESLGFSFIVPRSVTFTSGVVYCEFRTRPMLHPPMRSPEERKLHVVKIR